MSTMPGEKKKKRGKKGPANWKFLVVAFSRDFHAIFRQRQRKPSWNSRV